MMEREARAFGFEPQATCATFNISLNPGAKGVLPGAVYGIAVVLEDADALQLEEEAKKKKSLKNALSKLKRVELNGTQAIPLYWGKDATIGFRLYRHLLDKNPKAGCLGGRFYQHLSSADLIVASVPVNDFVAFEKHMEREYPPMLHNVKAANIGLFS